MLFLFLTFITILRFVLHVHALNETYVVSPSPAPSVLYINEEYAELTRRIHSARGTTARHPTSYLGLPFGEARDLGLDNTEGDLLARQV